ncbi:WD40-repeat-containing domain protein [Multifurca ochricompacta]|uniref:WD40-repeat-containing domain protein n=1 Tax=Multifurca ochricompacta TaxID=376703 RepID=A0AAD4MEH4_9AGAM|nr:WD40-repeat-containing domain protein [Multifurca ochricompacta]
MAQSSKAITPDSIRTEPASSSSQYDSALTSRLDAVSRNFFAHFNHRKRDSRQILADLAPVIMTPKMMAHAQTVSARPRAVGTSSTRPTLDFATIGRTPLRLGLGARRTTSRELEVVETASELLAVTLPDASSEERGMPSLLRGFEATVPSADTARARRRATRNVNAPRLGLKRLSLGARGLITEAPTDEAESEDDVVVVVARERGRRGRKKRGRESLSANKVFGREELERQTREIVRDKENLHVRRSLLHNDIVEITNKIEALDVIRTRLEQDLLKLQEDELELDDELLMVQERLELETSQNNQSGSIHPSLMASSRRRKGPAFLPSEHDELPPGVAFMSLECGSTPISSLDFSEPYGTLVTSAQDDAHPRVWDLLTGEEIGRLRGHVGTVKALQVEAHLCATGATDGAVRLWDLRQWDLSDVLEEAEEDGEGTGTDGGVVVERPRTEINGVRTSRGSEEDALGPCVRVLEGHSKAVTALYFENDTLVTGASDKTLRQWDLATGQCVMTMDILWAISHPSTVPAGHLPGFPLAGATAAAGAFALGLYEDFIGAVQSWEYALVSGSGDGAVRMWDMRTGQAHRTLLGHTGPVTCLQFDEIHVVSGSLDKSVRIWDLRTGGIFETVKYDHGVKALQFDSRKIVAAAGENGIKIYNRTSMQHSTLSINGHTRPVEKLRYMDRYLLSGGRDAIVKIWAL